jgi:hypothetical protein
MLIALSEREEIEQLLSETYAWVDHGEADRLSKLCGEGFALHAPGVDLDLEQFEQRMIVRVAVRCETRHQWSNLRVVDVDGDAVDRSARTPDGWCLASRTVTPVLDAPAA